MNRFRTLLIVGLVLAGGTGLAGIGMAQNTTAPSPPAPPIAPEPASATPAPATGAPPPNAMPPEEPAPAPPPSVEAADNSETAAADEEGAAPATPAKPAEVLRRPRYLSAVLQAVDKVTAKTLRFEAKLNEPVRYGGLVLTVHACETTAADEEVSDSQAHLEVVSQPASVAGRALPPHAVYRGWMFAASPGLHPFTSPGYDLWLIACKTPSPAEPAPSGVVGSR